MGRSHVSSWLFRGEQLVHEDSAVVAGDLLADAAVVVLVADRSAATRKVEFEREHRLFVSILVDLSVLDATARSLLGLEPGGDHRPPPSWRNVTSRLATRTADCGRTASGWDRAHHGGDQAWDDSLPYATSRAVVPEGQSGQLI